MLLGVAFDIVSTSLLPAWSLCFMFVVEKVLSQPSDLATCCHAPTTNIDYHSSNNNNRLASLPFLTPADLPILGSPASPAHLLSLLSV